MVCVLTPSLTEFCFTFPLACAAPSNFCGHSALPELALCRHQSSSDMTTHVSLSSLQVGSRGQPLGASASLYLKEAKSPWTVISLPT